MAFWHNLPGLICLGATAFSAAIAYWLFRPFRWQQFVARMPLFIVTGGAFLFVAIVDLPDAAPHLFERYLGHSINAMVTQRLSGGTIMTENWLTFWGESVGTIFDCAILASAIWAIVNLFRGHAVRSNVLTLALSFGWVCVYVWASFARFPF
jgi:hypothetical protein